MRSRSVIALVLLAAASLFVGAAPASAHSALVSSNPAAGAAVTAPLDRVSLTFSEAPLAGLDAGLRIEVRDGSDRDVSTGSVEVSGSSMSKAVALADGTYRVLWRYVSPDGHPITGEYSFTASGASAVTSTAAPTASPAPTTPAPSKAATSRSTATAMVGPAGAITHAGHSPVAVWVIGAVAVLAAAAAAAAAVVRRRSVRPAARDDDTPVRGSAD